MAAVGVDAMGTAVVEALFAAAVYCVIVVEVMFISCSGPERCICIVLFCGLPYILGTLILRTLQPICCLMFGVKLFEERIARRHLDRVGGERRGTVKDGGDIMREKSNTFDRRFTCGNKYEIWSVQSLLRGKVRQAFAPILIPGPNMEIRRAMFETSKSK